MGKSVSRAMVAMLAGMAPAAAQVVQQSTDSQLRQVREVLGSVSSKSSNSLHYFARGEQYTEHDPESPIGRLALQPSDAVEPTAQSATIVRAFQDGAFVVTQSEYVVRDRLVIVDVFRFDGGHIVEHWANVEKRCEAPNASGRTQLDGPTQVANLDATEKNKAAVSAYFEDVVFGAHPDRVAQYKNLSDFHQHNCHASDLKDGVPVVKPAFSFKIEKLERILGQGNFVLAVSTGIFNDVPTRFYDLYRIEGGKQVEHWDVLQVIP